MTEYELDKVCERNPNCDCNCIKCPLFARYQASELGYDEHENEEDED